MNPNNTEQNKTTAKKGRKAIFSDTLKYVDDYELVLERDTRGKLREKAVYKGTWFAVKGDCAEEKHRMYFAASAAVLQMLLMIAVQFMPYATDRLGTVTIPQALGMFPLLYALLGASSLPFRLKPMERARYMHSVIRMCRAETAVICFMTVSFLADILWRFISPDLTFSAGDAIHSAFLLLVIGCAAGVVIQLQHMDIREYPNDACKM